MSASDKKKLRNAQQADKLTEKQLTEQKEAKKLKTYSILFAVVLVLMVCFTVYTVVSRSIVNSGMRERNTVALNINEHKISNAELNYYFLDTVNDFYKNNGSIAYLFGLDASKPLNEQIVDAETGRTWADDFLSSAIESVKSVYALNDAAASEGFTLTQEQTEAIEMQISNLDAYAAIYGFTKGEAYLKAMYGNGANMDNFRRYIQMNTLADAYQIQYASSLSYEDSDLRAAEAENYDLYSSFTYNTYYLAASKFLQGGATDEEGTVTYSDTERAAALKEAEDTAKALAENTTAEDLNRAIAALPINEEIEGASSTAYVDTLYSNVASTYSEWVTDNARKAGDTTVIPNVTSSTDDEGNETETTNGFYVVLFGNRNDNNYPLANVRHILVSFEGGTYDSNTGITTYTDDEKAVAKTKAEELLSTWKNGDASVESFAALADAESTDTGSVGNGGLYEDIYPGQMVTNFNDWCFAEGRKSGDTGIVESDYGYHVMYYVSDSETIYRDFMIKGDLVSNDVSAWFNGLLENVTATEADTRYIMKDLILSAN